MATLLALLAPTGAAGQDSCPNAALRTGHGTHLPDCRAYEQVSPTEKNAGDVAYGPSGATSSPIAPTVVAPTGDLVSFSSFYAFAGNVGAPVVNQYLSSRDASGWSTEGVSPPKSAPFTGVDSNSAAVGFQSDLSHIAFVTWASPGQYSLFRRNPDGSFTGIADSAIGINNQVFFNGASSDFSKLAVSVSPGANRLFLWSDGTLTPVSTDSNGNIVAGNGGAGFGGQPSWGRFISADGSRVFWTGGGAHMYDTETQTQTDLPGFITASADGSGVLFGSGGDLHAYNTDTTSQTNLTAAAAGGAGLAGFLGLLGASDDLSDIYFVASGVLTSTPNSEGDTAVAGQPNLYALQGDVLGGGATTIAFVGTLAPGNQGDQIEWNASVVPLNHSALTQVSGDGAHLVFTSEANLTDYDSGGRAEVYLYDAGSDTLRCVSCNPDPSVAATGAADLGRFTVQPNRTATYMNVTSDGSRVLFETPDALLPQEDTNGLEDVYMWQGEGTGSCASSAQNGGCLHLVSTGKSADGSWYQGMSPTGDDVFFITRERLVGQDTDRLMDLYDARVGGGIASQSPPPPPPPCTGDACKPGASAPPPDETNGSGAFTGPGNPAANAADCSRLQRKVKRLELKVRKAKRKLRRADGKRETREARSELERAKSRLKGAKRQLKGCEGGAR